MFRQSPRRNGRNKGLKIKHVLQISLLLGVSVWLLYQVHHSDDDKKPPVPSDITKKLHNVVSKDMLRLGRKDLQPKVKQPTVENQNETGQHQADEGGNENEPEDLVQDHEEDRENGNKESGDQTREPEQEQKQGVVMDNKDDKKTNLNMKVEDVISESGKEITSRNKVPSGEVSTQIESNKETIQQIRSVGENSNLMPSVDNKIKEVVDRNLEDSMNSNGKIEKEKEEESNENENNEESEGGVLEEEKEALTDLGTLPESGIGGSRSTENTAAE